MTPDLTRAAFPAEAALVLTRAGIIRPIRPDRLATAIASLMRWGATPAAAYAAAASRYADEPAVLDDAGALTFGALHRRSDAIAAGLAAMGVGEGDRTAILCRNHRGAVEALLALSKLGADVVLLNTSFAAPQLGDVVRREGVRLVVHDEEFLPLLREARVRRRRVLAWRDGDAAGPSLDDLARDHDSQSVSPPPRIGRVVILTSGTTGTPRGASRSSPGSVGTAVAILSRIPLRARETTLIAAPLFHAWGFANLMLASLLSSTVVLQRQFDPAEALAAASRHRCQGLVAVPVMLSRMLELPAPVRAARRSDRLRVVAVSGSALPGDLAQAFMNEFGDVLYNLYGSTEAGWAAIAAPADMRAAAGTAGRPPRGATVRILDDAGVELPTGATGRIFVGSELTFEGYTGGGDKERLDGMVNTGDLGHFDAAGRLFVEGRDDDMIISGGENVFPAEVEDCIGGLAGVAEVAVVGVPDERFGQRLVAHVVRVRGARLDSDAVRSHVRAHLARYKVPRDVVFVDELPRNAAGKVLRRVLTEPAE